MASSKKLVTPIREFTAQIDQILGKDVEAYLGIHLFDRLQKDFMRARNQNFIA